MIGFATWPWEILIQAVGFCTCVFVFICLISFGIKIKEKTPDERETRENPDFRDQVLIQLAKQQSEMALNHVSGGVKDKGKGLEELLSQLEQIKNMELNVVNTAEKQRQSQTDSQDGADETLEDSDFRNGLYEKVIKAAENGLDVNAISEKLKVPRGEIKLVLKLRGRDHEFYKKH